MSRPALVLCFSLLVGAPAPAPAVVVEGLYEVRVAVPDQGAPARAEAFRTALTEVLVRVTGDRLAGDAPDLAPLLRNPQRYLNRFAYSEEPAPETTPGAAPTLFLVARFDPVTLERAVRDAGRPVWGRERPLLLVWLGIDDGATRSLAGDDVSEAAAAVRAAALRRGLTVRFPPADAATTADLTFADLWGGFEERVAAAVAPYAADLAIAGAVTRSDNTWSGRWLLVDRQGGVQRRNTQAGELGATIAALLDGVADTLAAEYAVHIDPALVSEVELTVSGVTSVEAYARVLRHLEGLSLVRDVDVARLADDLLVLRVWHAGSARNLEQTIALGDVLALDAGVAAGGLRYAYRQ